MVAHNLSYEKNLKQLAVVAKKSFTYNGQTYKPPKVLKVSKSFFRQYNCYLNCGGCCLDFTLDYLRGEYSAAVKKYPQLAAQAKVVRIDINGQPKEIVSVQHIGKQVAAGKERCDFLDLASGACTVHDNNPLSCRVELVKFTVIKDTGYISKRPFGRAWKMKRIDGGSITCDFSPMSFQQLENNDIPVLEQMKDWADYLGIETKLPRVLAALRYILRTKEIREFTV
jgi:Fe-S-cluster containining protein